jgi:hypothetical protein
VLCRKGGKPTADAPHPDLLPRWGRRNLVALPGLKNESNEAFYRASLMSVRFRVFAHAGDVYDDHGVVADDPGIVAGREL